MKILIRADASPEIGTGHLMRSLAIAQECKKREWNCTWVAADMIAGLKEKIIPWIENLNLHDVQAGSLEDAESTAQRAIHDQVDWIILDGYQFNQDFQSTLAHLIKDHKAKVLLLDDYAHLPAYEVDAILNQNAYAQSSLYSGKLKNQPELFLGPSYILLRNEFLEWKVTDRDSMKEPKKILITLGGVDLENITAKLMSGVIQFSKKSKIPLEITAVVGGANPHWEDLNSLIKGTPHHILKNTNQMPELMQKSDLVFYAGGTTSWEICYMGLPGAVLRLADNQDKVANFLVENEIALDLGWSSELSTELLQKALERLYQDHHLRSTFSENAQAQVDGNGRIRLLDHLFETQNEKH
jgi:UDP-2,4-diacetamido-2,4,6-trideoxy-beta-L-altropyranose hydrolase